MASNTAVAQVLGLPELLEHILFYVGLDSYHDSSDACALVLLASQGHKRLLATRDPNRAILRQMKTHLPSSSILGEDVNIQPATALFVLQRVNQTFRDVILDSGKLQSLMCLRQTSRTRFEHARIPLAWLLMRLGFRDVMVLACEPGQVGEWIRNMGENKCGEWIQTMGEYKHDNIDRKRFLQAENGHASWRAMTLVATAVIDRTHGKNIKGARFMVEGGTTLGEVYDKHLQTFGL